VDPAKSGVLMKGSVPPTWSGAFTYVSTTATITWSWTGLTIARADGSTTAIPNGSLAISGLTAATTYYFYPYYDDAALAIGWVAGGASSAVRLRMRSPRKRTPSRNSKRCDRASRFRKAQSSRPPQAPAPAAVQAAAAEAVCARAQSCSRKSATVAIETCAVGEHLRCPSILRADATTAATSASSIAVAAMGGTAEGWTRIIRHEVRDADTFIRLYFSNAETLDVTPHHIFTLADGSPMRAERLCLSDILVGRFGRLTLLRIETIIEAGQKVTISCAPYQQFFAGHHAASVLTHNYTFSS
jgi:hypothetical protein